MSRGDLRRVLFTGFALVNLVCWVGLAGLTGLLLTRRVDLGVETLLRQTQVTVVAAWERRPDAPPPVPRVEAAAALAGVPSAQPALDPVASATPSSSVAPPGPSPVASLTAPAGPTGGSETDRPDPGPESTSAPAVAGPPVSPALSGTTSDQPPAAWPSPTALPGMSQVASSPTRALEWLPLLLADPAFADLSLLNAEMDRSAPGRPVQIRYREEALNAEIARIVGNNTALPYRDVQIDLQCGRLVVTGKATVLGLEIDSSIEGTLSVRDCRPHFDVESVSVETLESTGFVSARVADMLEDAMAWYPADHALCLEQIVLEDNKASIYGHRR